MIKEISIKIEDVNVEEDIAYCYVDSMGYPIQLSRFLMLVSGQSEFDVEQLFRNVAVNVAMSGMEVSAANLPAVIAFIEAQTYKVIS